MRVQEELSIFYDDQATKYAQTREKYRSEAHLFLDEILSSPQKHLHILEFGCGSGRLLQQLTQIKDKKISYVGVDLSKKLLTIAKKQVKPSNKNLLCTFVCDDILNYIGSCKQESFDFVIGVASFQHMPSKKDRYYLLKNSYRVLVYEGKLIMSNWSLSQWFLRKYSKEMLRCLRYNALHRGRQQRNDLQLPWKTQGKTFFRFYHMFTKKELIRLTRLSGFILLRAVYIDRQGKPTSDWKISRNTFIVGQKSIFSSGERE